MKPIQNVFSASSLKHQCQSCSLSEINLQNIISYINLNLYSDIKHNKLIIIY